MKRDSQLIPIADSRHKTVLLHEAVAGLAVQPEGIYIDGTFGRGGHSRLILSLLGEKGRLMGIDRDPLAIEEAKSIMDSRFSIEHANFSEMYEIAQHYGLIGKINGILLDLGVSSPQIDQAERGFSFMQDGPLDMRMDTTQGLSASQWLANVEEKELTWVLKNYGEERFANRIARAIVGYNQQAKQNQTPLLSRTLQLVELINQAVPFKEKHKHPATRSFQAIRIYINSELDELTQTLENAISMLAIGGRLSVISFHSLEDRIVKQFMRKQSQGNPIPKGLPLREDQICRNRMLKTVGKAISASEQEIGENARSRSAILRIAERIEAC